MKELISEIVNECSVIDVHSHLFPSSYNELFLFGIDNLLTYHYLISELFIVWNEINVNDFYKMSIKDQADIIWQQLFVLRTPISEACRGVLTTCKKLGLHNEIKKRDLNEIRKYFDNIKSNPDNYDNYIETIFKLSNVDYTVMTNQIFELNELKYLENYKENKRFRSSLRIDNLIIDFENSSRFISDFGYSPDIEGVKNYIRYWNKKLKPEYLMASLPSDFKYDGIILNKDIMDSTTVINLVIVPIATELNLPIAFKFGTQRNLNPELKNAGDSVGIASVESLANLCRINNKCKFLATFLSRVNQHQLCVVARNFQNLHIYGCWWFLNNPSLIEEITKMRLEMLGLGFTAQHSDARVIEQLLYKWCHSKEIISKVLLNKYKDLLETGWIPTKLEIERDVRYILRKSYEDFMNKKL